MLIHDYDSQNTNTVPVRWCNKITSVEESKYEEKSNSALIVLGESISKKQLSKIPKNKILRLYIVPGAPPSSYQQGNQNPCILLSLAS